MDALTIRPDLSYIPTPSGPLAVSEFALGGVPRGAAMVLWDDHESRDAGDDIVRRLAEHGYESILVSVTPQLLSARQGVDQSPDEALMQIVMTLTHRLGERGWVPEQIGLLGSGLGGRAVLMAAAHTEYGAAVSISPCDGSKSVISALPPLSEVVDTVRTPVLGLFGDTDSTGCTDGLSHLAGSLRTRSPVYIDVVGYPGVDDDFYRTSTTPAAHAARFDAWQRTVEWMNLRVVPRLTPAANAWLTRLPSR